MKLCKISKIMVLSNSAAKVQPFFDIRKLSVYFAALCTLYHYIDTRAHIREDFQGNFASAAFSHAGWYKLSSCTKERGRTQICGLSLVFLGETSARNVRPRIELIVLFYLCRRPSCGYIRGFQACANVVGYHAVVARRYR